MSLNSSVIIPLFISRSNCRRLGGVESGMNLITGLPLVIGMGAVGLLDVSRRVASARDKKLLDIEVPRSLFSLITWKSSLLRVTLTVRLSRSSR